MRLCPFLALLAACIGRSPTTIAYVDPSRSAIVAHVNGAPLAMTTDGGAVKLYAHSCKTPPCTTEVSIDPLYLSNVSAGGHTIEDAVLRIGDGSAPEVNGSIAITSSALASSTFDATIDNAAESRSLSLSAGAEMQVSTIGSDTTITATLSTIDGTLAVDVQLWATP
jgi:hypothetical protein